MAPAILVLLFVAVVLASLLGGALLGNIVLVLLGTVLARRSRIELAVPQRREVAIADVPGPALALFFQCDLSAYGFGSLGYVTGPPQFGLWGYQQYWVDGGDLQTCVAVTVRKLSARSAPRRDVNLATPATVEGRAVVVITTNRVGSAQADDAYLLTLQLPGAEPDELVRAHRLRIEALGAVPTQLFLQVSEVEALARNLVELGLRLEVGRGRLHTVSQGVARLSWGACVRGGAAASPIARRLRARRTRRLPRTA